MTTQELIEFAVLDALALLDEEERADFERTLRAASPEVQAHVRREQTRFSRIEDWLPDVTPPAGLRAAVLEAVRKAMAEQRSRAPARAGRLAPPLFPSSRVSPVWRVASVGMLAAALVFGATTLELRGQFEELGRHLRSNALADGLLSKGYGRRWLELDMDPEVTHVYFAPASEEAPRATAKLLAKPGGAPVILCQNLPPLEPGRQYQVVVLDDAGRVVQQVGSFAATGYLLSGAELEVEVAVSAAARIAVIAPGEASMPVEKRAVLMASRVRPPA
jgi:hypothetical protein